MDFAKLFRVDGDRQQLLCVLQASEDDGAPEIQVMTYVAGVCVVYANRLVEVGEAVEDHEALLVRTRELFGGMTQDDAEQAYRMAVRLAARQAGSEFEASAGSVRSEALARALGLQPDAGEPPSDGSLAVPHGWLNIPMPSIAVH